MKGIKIYRRIPESMNDAKALKDREFSIFLFLSYKICRSLLYYILYEREKEEK